MKFTYHSLTTFLDTSASVTDIATALTELGLEVEEVRHLGAGLESFTVAHILATAPHPDAEKLQVCRVATHSGERQIVCGAPNARAGIKVVLADIGVTVPQNGMVIKPAKIRGVDSQGMLCSAYELGVGQGDAGILELPEDANVGASLIDVLGLNDTVFTIAITPNRGDCLGVYGIARDLAAKGLGTLRPLAPVTMPTLPDTRLVTLAHPDCAHFTAIRIEGVTNGESPAWLRTSLEALGQKSISTLVDITNYFSLTYGRPLHVYDADTLHGALQVRAATAGESFLALNDKAYTLPEGACVIADEAGIQAIGGIIGGSSSGCTHTTTNVLLEAAWFDPIHIAQTGRALQIDSDARYRFERHVDPEGTLPYAAMAAQMITELCGGTITAQTSVGAPPPSTHKITYDASYVNARLGIEIDANTQIAALRALGCLIEGNTLLTPSWRADLTSMADISEEIARLVGYHALPATPLPVAPISVPERTTADKARNALCARGTDEVVHFAFTSAENAALFETDKPLITVQNPISNELTTMRPHLYADMLQAVRHMIDRGASHLRLGQVGHVFFGVTPEAQPLQAASIAIGASPQHWQGSTTYDVFTAKADLFAVLSSLGVNTDAVMLSRDVPRWYHPSKAGRVSLGHKNILGYFGEIHPAILRHYGIETRVFASECWLDAVPTPKVKRPTSLTRSEFQASRRDFAFVVDATLSAGELQQALIKAGGKEVRDVTLFDVYQGVHVGEGKKSLAFAVTLQAHDRTLQEADIQAISAAILEAAQSKGAILR
jgi:phenylalanyl-tRNA synthetase beta chain